MPMCNSGLGLFFMIWVGPLPSNLAPLCDRGRRKEDWDGDEWSAVAAGKSTFIKGL